MLIGELILYRRSLNSADVEDQTKPKRRSYTLFKHPVHSYIAALYVSIGWFKVPISVMGTCL